MLRLKVIFLIGLLMVFPGASSANASDISTMDPEVVCGFLITEGFRTGSYRNAYDDFYACNTSYIELGKRELTLPNNIAYYVTGKRDKIEKAYLVINVNAKAKASSAHSRLLSASRRLIKNALGVGLSEDMEAAIKDGQSGSWEVEGVRVETKRTDWPTGKGYEVHFIIHAAS